MHALVGNEPGDARPFSSGYIDHRPVSIAASIILTVSGRSSILSLASALNGDLNTVLTSSAA
uniref:hypothetical protein n=1 Tax=Burkholderia anthina TaxID=179879 RepID=UPI00158B90A2|nr:hypothetical protein [Burkholderia anthina]